VDECKPLSNGTIAPWLRYAEWLITCPVILIALSRVGTEGGNYSVRTMKLLTSDQGTIVMGITAAYSQAGAHSDCLLIV
jgi:bacteriorhodopsin